MYYVCIFVIVFLFVQYLKSKRYKYKTFGSMIECRTTECQTTQSQTTEGQTLKKAQMSND
jgi:hypothetical protein